jgi:hypothetical protein
MRHTSFSADFGADVLRPRAEAATITRITNGTHDETHARTGSRPANPRGPAWAASIKIPCLSVSETDKQSSKKHVRLSFSSCPKGSLDWMNRVVASGHLCRGIKSDDLVAEDAATVLTVSPAPRINEFFEIMCPIMDQHQDSYRVLHGIFATKGAYRRTLRGAGVAVRTGCGTCPGSMTRPADRLSCPGGCGDRAL